MLLCSYVVRLWLQPAESLIWEAIDLTHRSIEAFINIERKR